ncbi:hypothetical protein MKW94_029243 [Papaver nudicaule]|uniref:Bet v I/Major latex protein domain-containing protein n=1 Tax=Papaver nudicaule TaxID=74823 RepID=A0AA42B2I4_PAPNU|nr:hypothetical protein [Papaver nudicaule]
MADVSGLVGKLISESEVSSDADKFYKIFKYHEDIPKAVPHISTSVKVVEGHGTTSGCIKEWTYVHEGKELVLKEKTTYGDETREILQTGVEGGFMNDYKKFDVKVQVTPKADGHGSIVKWTIEYEKKNEDSPVPFPYLQRRRDKFYKIFKYHEDIPKAVPHISTSVKVVEGHGPIFMVCMVKNWFSNLKEKTTYGDESREILQTGVEGGFINDYKMFDVKVQVTPKADGHGSIVKWAIEYEKINEDSPVPFPYLILCYQMTEGLNTYLGASD